MMARPQKKGLDYFPHDVDAASDEKIEWLRILYGNDGYAFYFILLERIYRTGEPLLLRSQVQKTILAAKCGLELAKFEQILQSALDCGLFDKSRYMEEKMLVSDGILERLAQVDKIRADWRQKKGGVFPGENLRKTPQSKGNQSKGKLKGNTLDQDDYRLLLLKGLQLAERLPADDAEGEAAGRQDKIAALRGEAVERQEEIVELRGEASGRQAGSPDEAVK